MIKTILAVVALTSFIGIVAALPDPPVEQTTALAKDVADSQQFERPRCFGQAWPFFNKACLRRAKPAPKSRIEEYQRDAASPPKAEDGSLAIVNAMVQVEPDRPTPLVQQPLPQRGTSDEPRVVRDAASKPVTPKIPIVPPPDPQYLPQSGPRYEIVKHAATIPMPGAQRHLNSATRLPSDQGLRSSSADWRQTPTQPFGLTPRWRQTEAPRYRVANGWDQAPGSASEPSWRQAQNSPYGMSSERKVSPSRPYGPTADGRQPPPPPRVDSNLYSAAPPSVQGPRYFVRQGGRWVPATAWPGRSGVATPGRGYWPGT